MLREKFHFLASLFSRRDWFKTRFVGNPEDRFSCAVACVACSTGGDFDFLAVGPWYDPVLTAQMPGLDVVTNGWCAYFFRLMH